MMNPPTYDIYQPVRSMNLNKPERFMFILLIGFLLATYTDAHAIYKSYNKRTRKMEYRSYQLEPLKMDSDRIDKLRAKIKYPVLIMASYLVLRFISTAIIEIICILNYPSAFTDRINELALILGRPLVTVPSFSVLLHLTLSICFLCGCILYPLMFEVKPLDALAFRLMMDPFREIQRTDLIIRELLEEFLAALDRINIDRTRKKKDSLRVEPVYDYDEFNANKRESTTRQVIERQLKQVHTMRPAIYDTIWFHTIYSFNLALVAIITAVFITTLLVPYVLFPWDKQRRCGTDQHCSILKVYPIQDLVACFELVLGQILADTALANQLFVSATNVMTQLCLVKRIKQSLRHCLKTTSNYFENLNAYEDRIEIPRIKRLRRNEDPDRHQVNSQETNETRRTRMEATLLRTLIHLMVALRDFRSISQLTSKVLEAYLSCMSFGLASLMVMDRLSNNEIQKMRLILTVSIWLATNIILIGCAYVFSRVMKLEKIAWSILAQLGANYQMALGGGLAGPADAGIGPVDLISRRWRNLVYGPAYCISGIRNSIRPFNISLTYTRVLELNFYILSFASLLQNF